MEDCSILGNLKKKVSLNFCGVVLSWACSLSAYSTDPTADPAAADPASPASQVFEAVETYQAASLGNHCPQNQLLLSSLEHVLYTSIAARGGGGSFKREKIYNSEEHVPIESFVTTLIHWTFFSDDANKVGICWLCRSGQLHVTPSSRWSLPRCHRSVRNDMRLFLRTKQYPIQLRTTKFWKVLPQYYSVLQSTTPESTTPVLLRTTKYYKVLVQYYSVLQSTTPVLLRTTKY